MPMPKPQEKETEEHYVSRFMADEAMIKEYPDEKQRAAVAYSEWRTNGLSNGSDDKCACGDAAGEHQYGTGACLSCSSCKMFKRATNLNADLKNAKVLRTQLITNDVAEPRPAPSSDRRWPESFPFRFIEPGLVNYDDSGKGTVLVRKGTLDKMAESLVGKPVFIGHNDLDPNEADMDNAQGRVVRTFYNAEDGWYHGEMEVWDPAAKAALRNGFALSCAYGVTEWGEPGIHNNIPYEAEVLGGEYQHLAIVPNPRYEGATIQMSNSKGGSKMKLNIWSWLKGDKDKQPVLQNAVEMESDKAVVEIETAEGVKVDVPLTKLVNAYKSAEEKKAAAAAASTKLADDQIVDIGGGKKVTVAELRNSFLRNAEDEEKEKKEKERAENEAAAAKEKEEKEKAENAMKAEHDEKEKDADSDHAKNEVKNCASCAAAKSNALANAAAKRPGNPTNFAVEAEDPYLKNSLEARINRGLERYGEPLVKK